MSNTLIGTSFQALLSTVKNARVVSEVKHGNLPMLGDHVTKTLDLDGNGTVDARLAESTKGTVTRRELTFLDAQGRPVDSFVSGTRHDPFFGLFETGKVWSHTHRDYEGTGATPVREVYERADTTTGNLSKRTTTDQHGTKVELDTDGNGSLETTEWIR